MAQLMPLPLTLAPVKSRLVLPFWYQLTWVVPDKGVYVCVLDLVFICSSLVCIFVFFCVTLGHFGFVFSKFIFRVDRQQ